MITPARAVADYRREIIAEIDRRIADLKNRACYGFVALEQFRLWVLTEPEEKEKET